MASSQYNMSWFGWLRSSLVYTALLVCGTTIGNHKNFILFHRWINWWILISYTHVTPITIKIYVTEICITSESALLSSFYKYCNSQILNYISDFVNCHLDPINCCISCWLIFHILSHALWHDLLNKHTFLPKILIL